MYCDIYWNWAVACQTPAKKDALCATWLPTTHTHPLPWPYMRDHTKTQHNTHRSFSADLLGVRQVQAVSCCMDRLSSTCCPVSSHCHLYAVHYSHPTRKCGSSHSTGRKWPMHRRLVAVALNKRSELWVLILWLFCSDPLVHTYLKEQTLNTVCNRARLWVYSFVRLYLCTGAWA